MGGSGSGRTNGKPIAENCRQIDICLMLRDGSARDNEITSGVLHWSIYCQSISSVSYICDLADQHDAQLTLKFMRVSSGRLEPVSQVIRLQSTTPYLGGRRWWMTCPFEHVRVAKLYLPLGDDRFASRKALRIGYRSQRLAPADRLLDRMFRLRAKLGIERGRNGPLVRPRGMWQRTFARHQITYYQLNAQIGASMITPAMVKVTR